ncbi:DUF488 domain-containing protein [Phenylobacterium sp.]|uniref:DUF488 domain-containing protein n=1 Tax=Phenylobacterium sp. TaxID=1871053 RepID=UPI002CB1F4B6|nr:DUF488 domain-containing protein [Phenylobacterium sp.]HLZ74366.1 DUF488 domain-containing protein [Phenylobacterium sp.]
MKLATVGYERDTQPAVIDRLKAAGVELVIDVRAVAASRKAGFSKTLLSASLNAEGIGYVHLRQLGTPKPGRDAARKGHVAEMHEIFKAHMAEPGARMELAKATELVRDGKKVALLCYEADAAGCHRTILANWICEDLGCGIENL